MQEYDDTGRRRLEPQGDDDWTTNTSVARRRAVRRRDAGIRQTRRISAWTAAALVAGVAASAGYFAHTVATPAARRHNSNVSRRHRRRHRAQAEPDAPRSDLRRLRCRGRNNRRIGRDEQRCCALAGQLMSGFGALPRHPRWRIMASGPAAVAERDALGTTARLAIWPATSLRAAVGAIDRELDRLDLAASRFRADSEISRVHARQGGGWRSAPTSPKPSASPWLQHSGQAAWSTRRSVQR